MADFFSELTGKLNARLSSAGGLVLQLFTFLILPLTFLLIVTSWSGKSFTRKHARAGAERDHRTARAAANTLQAQIDEATASFKRLTRPISLPPSRT